MIFTDGLESNGTEEAVCSLGVVKESQQLYKAYQDIGYNNHNVQQCLTYRSTNA